MLTDAAADNHAMTLLRKTLMRVPARTATGRTAAPYAYTGHMRSDRLDDSMLRRLVRLSDALRDLAQNPHTLELTSEELDTIRRLAERTDTQIARARKL